MITVSPKVGELLVRITQTPDVDLALRKILTEYLELKIKEIGEKIKAFEDRWGLSFEEFSHKCQNESLNQDIYSYEVEREFWEWERLETLRKHYCELESRWM